jgi:cytochrome c2
MYRSNDPALGLIAQEVKASRWRHGPDLTRVGSKTNAGWIFNWIKNPRHYWRGSRMPSLRLSDGEAADVTAFLVTLRDDESARAKVPALYDLKSDALADRGEYWVRTYGCYGCHDIKGFENAGKVSVSLSEFGAKRPEELSFGNAVTEMEQTWLAWTKGKLTFSRRYATEAIVQRMPNFRFSEGEADTVALVLKSWDGRRVYEDFSEPVNKWMSQRQQGRLVTEFYNCAGCHVLEGQRGDIRQVIGAVGFSPPNLNTEGRKVQSDWLYRFLSGPTPIRPWLKVRMPTFNFSDSEKTTVVDYFQGLEEYEEAYDYIDVSSYSAADLARGQKLIGQLQCLTCHVLEGKASYTPAEAATLAPNLRMAYQRLRPNWIVDWLHDPQVIDPGTRMPSFFYSEGVRLYDDADEQMRALRDHIMALGAPKP